MHARADLGLNGKIPCSHSDGMDVEVKEKIGVNSSCPLEVNCGRGGP